LIQHTDSDLTKTQSRRQKRQTIRKKSKPPDRREKIQNIKPSEFEPFGPDRHKRTHGSQSKAKPKPQTQETDTRGHVKRVFTSVSEIRVKRDKQE
jgi:hypothetical protein